MGQEILYCVVCQTQLRGADFDKRRAFRVDGKGYCVNCAPAGKADPPSTRLRESPARSSTRRVSPAASSSKLPMAIGGAAALVLAGVGIAVMSGGDPPPPSLPPSPIAAPPPKVVRKGEEPALKVFPELAGLDEEFQRALQKDEFTQALRLIENARSRNKDVEWTQIMSQRKAEVQAYVERTLQALKAQAVDAKRGGNLEESRKIRERVSKWDVARALPELDAALSAVPDLGKVVVFQDFNAGRGRFMGGEATEGALSVPPQGVVVEFPFGPTVQPTAVVRFRVKAPAGFQQLEVMVWSQTAKVNSWVHVKGFKPGEWRQVEIQASEFRAGYDRKGPGVIGHEIGSLRVYFDVDSPDVRVLIDDFETRD